MGYERPHTKAELAKRAANQQDPVFLEWLAGMDRELEKFFAHDVPDMPVDPYTPDGLNRLEDAALQYFWGEPKDLEWPQREDRFARFLGQMLVRKFEGEWRYIDLTGDGLRPVVSLPFRASYYDPVELIGTALAERSGGTLSWMLGHVEKGYALWKDHGRLPLKEWAQEEYKYR